MADVARGGNIAYWRFEPGALTSDSGGNPSGPFNLTNVGGNNNNDALSLPLSGNGSFFPKIIPLTGQANLQATVFTPTESPGDIFNAGSRSALSLESTTIEAFVTLTGAQQSFLERVIYARETFYSLGLSGSSSGSVPAFTAQMRLNSGQTVSRKFLAPPSFVMNQNTDYYVAASSSLIGNSTAGHLRCVTFYLKDLTANGPLRMATNMSFDSTIVSYSSTWAYIGYEGFSNQFYWEGLMDELRISDKALSQSELLLTAPSQGLPIVTVTALDPSASESGDPAKFRVSRTGPTTSSLLVSFAVNSEAAEGSDFSAIGTTLLIPSGQAYADIDILPLQDGSYEPPERIVVTIQLDPAYVIGTEMLDTAVILDDEIQSYVFSTDTVTVNEGSNNTFTVRLANPPSTILYATISRSAGDTNLTVSPSILVFTPSNYATPQTVTINAAEDVDAVNGSATISCSSPGILQNVTAVEVENDPIGFIVSNTGFSVTEGATGTFTVRLNAPPVAQVAVSVARTAGDTDISVSGGSSLDFSSANWDSPQTVTLTAAADADAAIGSATISVSSPGYATANLTVTEQDTTPQAILPSLTSVNVSEGGSNTFTVLLQAQPGANIVVGVARTSGDASITVSPATLTFTSTDWNLAQTVTLNAAEDPDAAVGVASITLSSTGLTSKIVTAGEVENDTLGIILTPNVTSINEGGTGTFTVQLSAQPLAATTVNFTRTSGDTDLSITGGSSKTFSTANWNAPQSVTLTCLEDADLVNGSTLFTAAAAGLPSVTLNVTENDNDLFLALITRNQAGVTVSCLGMQNGVTYSVLRSFDLTNWTKQAEITTVIPSHSANLEPNQPKVFYRVSK